MNSLANFQTYHKIPDTSLETILEGMLQYGKPRVSYLDGGWYASVEMNTPALGANFSVGSEFKNPTAIAAARQCLERVEKVVQMYR